MTLSRKRCLVCRRWFAPRVQNPQQKTCSEGLCQKSRRRKACLVWNKKHPHNDHARGGKTRAWAKVFPDYWQRYRAAHRDYAGRERARMRAKRRKLRRVAKQDAWRQIAVDRLITIAASPLENVAKQDAWDRRVDGVLDYLIWKEDVAKQDAIVCAPLGT